jgi:hypothetical protein
MKRARVSGRHCSFEALEGRQMMAGDVTAKISGGDLVIKGDSLANGITIAAGTTAGTVVVTGITAGGSATTVNGGTTAVTLSGFTGDLKIDLKGGDDNVSVTGLAVSDDGKIKAGRGADTVSVSDTTFGDDFKTDLGDGDDTLTLDSVTVTGRTKIEGHHGDDDTTITDSTFSKLHVSLGRGDDTLTMSGTKATVDTKLNGKKGTNTFDNNGNNTLASLTVKHFNENTDGGSSSTGVDLSPVSAITEGGQATVTGSFTDSTVANTHTLTVGWNDPNKSAASTFAVPATTALTTGQTINSSTDSAVLSVTSFNATTGEVNFSVKHTYLNDGAAPGNSTNSDTSTITVTVTGASNFNQSDTTTVTINNSSPTVNVDAVADVSENGKATLTGSYTDAGILDGHGMAINWGDPNNSTSSSFTIPALQTATGTTNLTTGQTFTSAADGAVLTITSVNATNGQVGFSVQHQYLDDGPASASGGNGTASDSSTISVSVTDQDGQAGAKQATVNIKDVAPTISVNQPTAIGLNATATITGSFTDIGLLDQHPLAFGFGDNSSAQMVVPAIRTAAGATQLTVGQTIPASTGTGTLTITSVDATTGQVGFSIQHKYTAAGNNIPIEVTILDDDTLTNTASTTITVSQLS